MADFEVERIKTLEEKVMDLEKKLNKISEHIDLCDERNEGHESHETRGESFVDKLKKDL